MFMRWATITGISPLRLRLDGDTDPLPFVPDSLIDPLLLRVDDRVRCDMSAQPTLIVGHSGGTLEAASTPREVAWSAGSLASNAEAEIDIALPSACVVQRVVTNGAARVRLYDRAAKSTADASRASGVMPTGDHGVLLELDGGTAAEDVGFYPPAIISNRDGTSAFKVRVKNLSGSTGTVTGSFYVVL